MDPSYVASQPSLASTSNSLLSITGQPLGGFGPGVAPEQQNQDQELMQRFATDNSNSSQKAGDTQNPQVQLTPNTPQAYKNPSMIPQQLAQKQQQRRR